MPLSIVKIEDLLARQGVCGVVPDPAPVRGRAVPLRVKSTTVRINDGEPGIECQSKRRSLATGTVRRCLRHCINFGVVK